MAFGSSSKVFSQFVKNPLLAYGNSPASGFGGLTVDAFKAALFGNSVTPDNTAAVASTGYNTGTWTTGNEITDATNWAAGGRTMAALSVATAGAVTTVDCATDTASGGVCTFSNPAYGVLVYDSSITGGTVAKQGLCYNAFGGPAQVTGGSFTVVWNANGLFQATAS